MADIESRLQSLKTQQHEAERRRAQAEAKLDNVKALKDDLRASLKEHGYSSPEEAREAVKALSAEAEDVLRQIEEKVQSL